MVTVEPLHFKGHVIVGIEVRLPKTTLLILQTKSGYVMCGALDIALLRDKLANRGILAARAVGVKTMNELWNGTIESCTQAAEDIHISPGMSVQDALFKMLEHENE